MNAVEIRIAARDLKCAYKPILQRRNQGATEHATLLGYFLINLREGWHRKCQPGYRQ